MLHGEKKLTRILFLSGLGVETKWTTIVNNRFRASHCVYNSWPHRRWDDGLLGWQHQVAQEAVVIFANILYLKAEYLAGMVWGGLECGNRISDANLLIEFHSNYGSTIVLHLQDINRPDHGTDKDERRTDGRLQHCSMFSIVNSHCACYTVSGRICRSLYTQRYGSWWQWILVEFVTLLA